MKLSRSKSMLNIFMLLTLLLGTLGVTPAYAAGIVVTTNADSGAGSLRQAILDANANGAGADTITFAVDYTITLASQLPAVTTDIIINGNGEANTIIQANAAPNAATYRVFEVTSAGDLTLDGLTVRNGNCNGSCDTNGASGGGVYNAGALTVSNVTFSANSAGMGGGMFNMNSLTLMTVTFSANSATYDGGGMYNWSNSPTLTNVTFSANSAGWGGGMFNDLSSLTLTTVTFSANSATYDGGGMYNNSSSATLTNVTFSANSAAGGGGMYNNSNSSPTLTNVTFSGNSASSNGGGGMLNNSNSSPTLTNVTFSGNSASSSGGGGMLNNSNSSPTLMNVTFSGNSASSSGGGMYNYSSSPTLTNVIIADSANGGDCFNFTSTLNAASGNNLIEDAANACGLTDGANGNIIGQAPALNPTLANNGGSTQTHALLAGSPAIDTGTNTGCPPTDQRGVTRPQGVHCDIGAYELDITPPIVNSIIRLNPSPTNLASVSFTVTFSEPVTGVDVAGPTFDDFSLAISSGISGVSVIGVSGSGTTYIVTVSTGSGNGNLRLDVGTGGNIVDLALNPLAGGFTTGEVYSVIKAATFTDVPLNYWANSYIERLYNAGITGGCSLSPLMYCPETNVNRAQMAVFLLRGEHGSTYAPPAVGIGTGFTDVPADYWAAAWIKQLALEGITSGCGPGLYCPEISVTRDQMAVFLLRAEHGASYTPPPATGVFTDVPSDYWAAAWIERLAAEGITGGCGVGTYCPTTPVTRAQMAVFLVRTFNLP